MKKQFFAYFFAAMSLGGIFTSCSDDDPIVNPVPETTTYTEQNGLSVTFNGEALAGKEVVYTPSKEDATKAVLELKGADFDLMQHMTKANGLIFNTPGVLPGSANLKLDLDLTIEGDKCLFSSQSETEFCSFTYQGEITKSNLNISFTDVKLKNTDLAGQWNMVPFIKSTDPWESTPVSNPLFLKWDSDSILNIELAPGYNMPMPIETVVNLALGLELIDNGETKVSALEFLTSIFKNVRLAEDGNITAELIDVANGKNNFEVSPNNVAFYVVDKTPTATERGSMRLFLNLETIDKLSKQNSRSARAGLDLGSILSFINPKIQNGIPLTLVPTEDKKMAIIVDSEILVPVMKNILAPVLSDPEVIKTLSDMLTKTPGMESFAPMAAGILKSLPATLQASTKIEIGLKFEQSK